MDIRNEPPPPHPGYFIAKGFLLPRDITITELAHGMDVPRDEVRQLIDGEIPCTLRLAERLAKALHTDKDFWLSAQGIYDAWLKREGLYEDDHLAAN